MPRAVDHLIVIAENLSLAAVVYVGLVLCAGAIARLGGFRPATGRALLREIRASFYRKLFLAFVAAAVVPVLALALLIRASVASQLLRRASRPARPHRVGGQAGDREVTVAAAARRRRHRGASATK